MEEEKRCFRCGGKKPLSEFYPHKQMADGHLNKCKDCTKGDTKKRADELIQDPKWAEQERARNRDKYYRLGYKDKHKPTTEEKREIMKRYKEKYPEKQSAKNASQHIKRRKGHHNHHWSYLQEHWKDVIELSNEEHAKLHRYIVYDQERKMYRRTDTLELLDTREAHLEYLKILNKIEKKAQNKAG